MIAAATRNRPRTYHSNDERAAAEADVVDIDIANKINELSDEEEALYRQAGDGRGLSTEDVERLQSIKVELDRCYDLLHQREARRAAGLDPTEAEPRSAEVVEHYQQ
jgi:hypothetical protein